MMTRRLDRPLDDQPRRRSLSGRSPVRRLSSGGVMGAAASSRPRRGPLFPGPLSQPAARPRRLSTFVLFLLLAALLLAALLLAALVLQDAAPAQAQSSSVVLVSNVG